MRKKVLLITYYWPPAGGPSVQRWLKFIKFLPENNIQPLVLTVDEKYATYAQIDYTFLNEISSDLQVFRTKSFEPLKYFSILFGKKNIPVSGFANVNKKSFLFTIARFIRGNFFIPDPRRGWNKYAFKEAKRVINKYQIDTIITTGPPNSTHLIGEKLKEKLNVKWICDMRDPWTDIFYYKDVLPLKPIKKLDARMEKRVIENCNHLTTVSEGLKDIFESKTNKISKQKITVIPNGYDADDFKNKNSQNGNNIFTIAYVGTMTQLYQPKSFFEAINICIQKRIEINIKLIGQIEPAILEMIDKFNLNKYVTIIGPQSHEKAIEHMRSADALLLLIPNTKYSKGILTGKLFEYLASKRPIIFIGPEGSEIADIIHKSKSGLHFTQTEIQHIADNIIKLVNHEKQFSFENIDQFTRQNLTKKLANIIINQ